jgi:hypothetical protein
MDVFRIQLQFIQDYAHGFQNILAHAVPGQPSDPIFGHLSASF